MTTNRSIIVAALTLIGMTLTGCASSAGAKDGEEADDTEAATGESAQEVRAGQWNVACADTLSLKERADWNSATLGTMHDSTTNILSRGFSSFYVDYTTGGWAHGYSSELGRWGFAASYWVAQRYGKTSMSYWCCTDAFCRGGG